MCQGVAAALLLCGQLLHIQAALHAGCVTPYEFIFFTLHVNVCAVCMCEMLAGIRTPGWMAVRLGIVLDHPTLL